MLKYNKIKLHTSQLIIFYQLYQYIKTLSINLLDFSIQFIIPLRSIFELCFFFIYPHMNEMFL